MADDPTPPADDSGVADTAKKLADQAIDAVHEVGDLAVSIPVDTAKVLLSKIEQLAAKLRETIS